MRRSFFVFSPVIICYTISIFTSAAIYIRQSLWRTSKFMLSLFFCLTYFLFFHCFCVWLCMLMNLKQGKNENWLKLKIIIAAENFIIFYTFQKHANSEVQKPTDSCVFRCCQSSKQTSWETEYYLNGFKSSWFVICDWWISMRVVCFCVSWFVACNHNFDWRQQKKQYCKGGFKTLEFACL